jgi:hypothetical protein
VGEEDGNAVLMAYLTPSVSGIMVQEKAARDRTGEKVVD